MAVENTDFRAHEKNTMVFKIESSLAERRKTIEGHIELLESRYPEAVRREAVNLLMDRLASIS